MNLEEVEHVKSEYEIKIIEMKEEFEKELEQYERLELQGTSKNQLDNEIKKLIKEVEQAKRDKEGLSKRLKEFEEELTEVKIENEGYRQVLEGKENENTENVGNLGSFKMEFPKSFMITRREEEREEDSDKFVLK